MRLYLPVKRFSPAVRLGVSLMCLLRGFVVARNQVTLLEALPNVLLNVINACGVFLSEEECDAKLKPIIRRVLVQQSLSERALLAISGTQGAGKTTLLKHLYGLDDSEAGWLQGNAGRGEKHPILVTEGNTEHTYGIIKTFSGEVGQKTIKEEPLTQRFSTLKEAQEEFRRAAADRDGNAGELMLELKVPPKLKLGDRKGWILLPGYEKSDNESLAWQDTMKAVASSAYGAIIVTDENRLAGNQEDLIRDTRTKYFESMKPVVVITRTEDKTDEECEQLKELAAKIFSLEKERVVCTGVKDDDAAYMEKWKGELFDIVGRCAGQEGKGGGNLRHQELVYLIDKELRNVLASIKKDVSSHILGNIEDGEIEKWIENVLENFDKAKEKFYRKYEKAVISAVDQNMIEANENLLKILVEKSEGVVNHIGNFFKKETSKILRVQSFVEEAVKRSDEVRSLGDLVDDEVSQPIRRVLGGSIANGKQDDVRIMEYDKGGEVESSGTPAHALMVLSSDSKVNGRIDGLDKAVQALPAMATEIVHSLSHYEPFQNALRKVPIDLKNGGAISYVNPVQHFTDNVGDAFDRTREMGKVCKSFQELLGKKAPKVGLAGRVIAGTLGVEAAAGGGAAFLSGGPITLAAGAIFATGYLGVSMMQEARVHDRANREAALGMLESIRSARINVYLSNFDDVMESTRDGLNNLLKKRYNVSEKFSRKDRAIRSIVIAQQIREELHEVLGENINVC